MNKPLIGVTCPKRGGYFSWLCIKLAIFLSGGIPKRILNDEGVSTNALSGLILSGGTDINPKLYGGTQTKGRLYDDHRDTMECSLAKQFIHDKKPVFGICRGAQLLNVILGGNLHHDVSKIYEDFVPVNSLLGKIFYRKKIKILPGSHLFECMLRRHEYWVNSLHHQAINKLGNNLVVTAKEEYGLVQAIEHDDMQTQFIMGVQWHPEFLLYKSTARSVFRNFIQKSMK